MRTSSARAMLLAVGLVLLGALPGGAVVLNDHLKCHRVKDLTKPGASADLVALQPDFTASGCKIKGAKLFCVPVSKTNVSPPPPRPDIVGQPLQVDFTCYTLQCPVQPPNKKVVDQFGFRQQAKYKTSLLCVPTLKACESTGAHMCGGGCEIPGQACLPNLIDVCTCQDPPTTTTSSTTTSTTESTTTSTLPLCAQSGFPLCNGTCTFPKICEKDFPTQNCICCGLSGVACTTNLDCCTQACNSGTCN